MLYLTIIGGAFIAWLILVTLFTPSVPYRGSKRRSIRRAIVSFTCSNPPAERGSRPAAASTSSPTARRSTRPCSGRSRRRANASAWSATHTFMLGAGVIEVIAGLLVAVAPRIGGWVVGVWLCGIILNLLTIPAYFDLALRDLGLALGAFAMARLSVEYSAA